MLTRHQIPLNISTGKIAAQLKLLIHLTLKQEYQVAAPLSDGKGGPEERTHTP